MENAWHSPTVKRDLLLSACALHEIGLSVEYKQAPLHAAWLVRNLHFPGYTPHRRSCLPPCC
ncbi:hypothetical protein ACNKHS_22635 [Shigella flexneri]